MKQTLILKSQKETKKLAERIVKEILKENWTAVILLQGNLGAGKTFLAGEILKLLKAEGPFTSPTFVIMKEYVLPRSSRIEKRKILEKGAKIEKLFEKVYHFDCYRIKKEKEILDLGWREILTNKNNLILVEWPEKIEKILPSWWIKIYLKIIDENIREAKIYFSSKKFQK